MKQALAQFVINCRFKHDDMIVLAQFFQINDKILEDELRKKLLEKVHVDSNGDVECMLHYYRKKYLNNNGIFNMVVEEQQISQRGKSRYQLRSHTKNNEIVKQNVSQSIVNRVDFDTEIYQINSDSESENIFKKEDTSEQWKVDGICNKNTSEKVQRNLMPSICDLDSDVYQINSDDESHNSNLEKHKITSLGEITDDKLNQKIMECVENKLNGFSLSLICSFSGRKVVHPVRSKYCNFDCVFDFRYMLSNLKHQNYICPTCNSVFMFEKDLIHHKYAKKIIDKIDANTIEVFISKDGSFKEVVMD